METNGRDADRVKVVSYCLFECDMGIFPVVGFEASLCGY